MTAGVAIRALGYADLTRVIALERQVFPAPWSLAMFSLELAKPDGVFLAAERQEELVAYAICSRYDTVWHVMNICVAPAARRRGIGSAMLERMIELVGPDARLTLEVRPSNAAGIALYEGHGFLAAGIRRRYYPDNGEDAIIMWRTAATLRGSLEDVPSFSPVKR